MQKLPNKITVDLCQ